MLYGAAGAGLALTGPGALSLDALLGISAVWTPAFASVALLVAMVGGLASLAVRRPPVTV